MITAVLKIKENTRPSGKRTGYRIIASVPNRARYQYDFQSGTGAHVQSHAEKYRIASTLDYPKRPTEEQLERFVQRLRKWHKVTSVIFD